MSFPATEFGGLKTWIGVGGSPESVVRAARYDLPLMLAIIGGDPKRFKPYVDLYHRAYAQLGKPAREIGMHSPGYVADSDAQAREELYPDYKRMRDRIGAERGWPPMRADEFAQEIEHGSLYVGSPETVARKIAATVKALGVARFDLKYSAGRALARETHARDRTLRARGDPEGAGDRRLKGNVARGFAIAGGNQGDRGIDNSTCIGTCGPRPDSEEARRSYGVCNKYR